MMDVEHHCRQIDDLLPWYVNRSLVGRDAEIVQAHLDDCERCRDEAEWLAQLGAHLRNTGLKPAGEAPLDALRSRIAAERNRQRNTRYAIAAGVMLALAAVLGTVLAWQPLAPRYHTVTDAVPPAASIMTLDVELAPDAPLSALHGILERHDAAIVAGPDAAGRVRLEFRLAEGETGANLLRALHADTNVTRIQRADE